jgi:hypothetical protein
MRVMVFLPTQCTLLDVSFNCAASITNVVQHVAADGRVPFCATIAGAEENPELQCWAVGSVCSWVTARRLLHVTIERFWICRKMVHRKKMVTWNKIYNKSSLLHLLFHVACIAQSVRRLRRRLDDPGFDSQQVQKISPLRNFHAGFVGTEEPFTQG